MSQLRIHIAGGAAAFVLYAGVLLVFFSLEPTPALLLWGCVALMGALLPDVDTNSHAQKLFYGLLLAVDLFLIVDSHYREAALLGLLALLPQIAKHRGWTHSLVAALVLPSPLLIAPLAGIRLPYGGLEYYVPFLLGYTSHLVIDKHLRVL